jgi:uncharacterized protein (TIGR00369 family)
MTCVDKATPGVTVWTMPAAEHMANPVGVVQGGFLAAFADSAMATATVTNLRGRRALTANTDLTFVEAEITDTSGRLVAKAASTYLLTPRD